MPETSEDLRKRLELQDPGHEMAGLETGRAARFGIGAGRVAEAKEKERSARAFRNALERLLQDAEYRRLYEQLGERLGDAEREADATITALEEQLRKVGVQIAVMESSAARGPVGRAVFQYADGRAVYADGSDVPDAIAKANLTLFLGRPSAVRLLCARLGMDHAVADRANFAVGGCWVHFARIPHDCAIGAQNVHERDVLVFEFTISAIVRMAGGHACIPEVQQMRGRVSHGARDRAGLDPAFVIVGYDEIADTDVADRFFPDLRENNLFVVCAVRTWFDRRIKRPHLNRCICFEAVVADSFAVDAHVTRVSWLDPGLNSNMGA